MDLCTNLKKLSYRVQELEDLAKFEAKFFVSCQTNYGIDSLKEYLLSQAKLKPWAYKSTVNTTLSYAD
jgi:ribosome-interacting GTPase 1